MTTEINRLITAIENGTATGKDLAQFSSDFDPYGFYDSFDGGTFDECFITATEFFENELTTTTGRTALINGLKEYLENE